MSRSRRAAARKSMRRAVVLGTAGLTSCITSGSVDPPPPPPRCDNLNAQRDLRPTVAMESGVLVVRIEYVGQQPNFIQDPRVSVVEGASLKGVRTDAPPGVVVELVPEPDPTRIFFVLDGSFAGSPACAFQRGFTITFDGGLRITDSRLALPFAAQPRATIVIVGRDGSRVTLRAVADPPGRNLAWAVSGGRFVPDREGRCVWELPPEPGLYQAELFVDHGEDGFALDTLALEVQPERAQGA
jgi:hypothetical protein